MNRAQNQNFRRWLALSKLWAGKMDGLNFSDAFSRVSKKFRREVSQPDFETAARETFDGSEAPEYRPALAVPRLRAERAAATAAVGSTAEPDNGQNAVDASVGAVVGMAVLALGEGTRSLSQGSPFSSTASVTHIVRSQIYFSTEAERMGRRQTIFVDPLALLRAIGKQIASEVRDIDARLAERDLNAYQHLHRARRVALRPMQDLDAWSGKWLTASERIRHQDAIRELEAAGLIDRDGRAVSLTAAGWKTIGLPDCTKAPT